MGKKRIYSINDIGTIKYPYEKKRNLTPTLHNKQILIPDFFRHKGEEEYLYDF